MICGIDEAGRGPVMGPLIVCGVRIGDDSLLKGLGVRDSKKLSRAKREDLAPKIEKLADAVEIVEISASEIDSIRDEITMNQLEVKIFASIIGKLAPDIAYVDAADVDEARFASDIMKEVDKKDMLIVSRHEADDIYPVVSAASILAKIRRDARMREIELEIGESIGSGYPSDPITMAFLDSYFNRNGRFPPHTRISWDTCAKITEMKSIKKLDSF